MKDSPTMETNPTKVALIEAAKSVLLAEGYAGLSTRAIAAAADTQMSQIRYHFGSKEGMVLALFEYMNAQLIARQSELFAEPNIAISTKWEIACDYLDSDIDSGYVRVLQEMLAVGWSNPQIGEAVRSSLGMWAALHRATIREFVVKRGTLGPFEPDDIAALVASVFIGVEALTLLGYEGPDMPLRRALRRLGDVIRHFESLQKAGE